MQENINQLIESASRKKREGHYEAAYDLFKRVLSIIGLEETTELMVLSLKGRVDFDIGKRKQLLLESNIRSQVVDLLRILHRPEEAIKHALIALYIDKYFHGDHNDTAASLVDVGLLHLELHKPELAKKYFDESGRIDEAILKEDPNNELANWRSDARAGGLEGLGNIVEAIQELNKKIPIIKTMLKDRQNVVIALNDYSQHLQNLGEHNDAEKVLQEAIDEQNKIGFKDHPQFGILYSNLASLHLERGQFEQAKELRKRSSIYRNVASQDKWFLDDIKYESDMYEKMLVDISPESSGPHPKHDYFISYNMNDEERLNELKVQMKQTGVSCWTFKEKSDWQRQRAYETIMNEMKAEIDNSYALLVIASGTSLTSSCVYDEIDYACNHKKPILVWYPEGTRVRPLRAAEKADDSAMHLLMVARKLFSSGVYSYYGSGLRNNVIKELSNSLMYRLLLMVKHHRLHTQYRLEELRERVRHGTKMTPYFIDEDGKRIFIEKEIV
ncbi:MAG: tetratricopeptide repeat protein [Smithella sp.]